MMKTISNRKLVVIGQGYVGLPLSMAACDAGFSVVGIDLDSRKVDLLNSAVSYIEDVSSQDLKVQVENGRYSASSDYSAAIGFGFAVITVPTPLKSGNPDLSFIEQAAQALASYVTPGATVILESTTYPGTTEELLVPALESASNLVAGKDFSVGYSPERIDPGNSTWNLLNTPKVTSGINLGSLDDVNLFYRALGINVVPVSGTREAELTKLIENTFRHVNIALVNELAVFSRQLGVNIWEAIDAASSKPFGFMKFTPGPGVGGHCLPVDPSYLSWAIRDKVGSTFRFVELANSVNDRMPAYVAERGKRLLGVKTVAGTKILLVGLAYKPDTGDIRESPALDIASIFSAQGATVYGLDDHVMSSLWPTAIIRVEEPRDHEFDLVIVLTKHSRQDLEFFANGETPVLDTRNCISGRKVEIL